MIGADDRGLLGDGLFETILWRRGALARFAAHARRLIAGCRALGLPPPTAAALEAAALDAVERAGLAAVRSAVRLTWTAAPGGRGLDRPEAPAPRLIASAAPSPAPTGPARLIVAAVRRNEGSPTSRLKSLSYLDNVLARREARRAGADEALMLNNRGEIACAAAANIFWFEDDTLVTPALACGVLAGVTRAAVLRRAGRLGLAAREVAAPLSSLAGASGLFLTSSLIGLRPVARLDDAEVAPHPLTARLGSPT